MALAPGLGDVLTVQRRAALESPSEVGLDLLDALTGFRLRQHAGDAIEGLLHRTVVAGMVTMMRLDAALGLRLGSRHAQPIGRRVDIDAALLMARCEASATGMM